MSAVSRERNVGLSGRLGREAGVWLKSWSASRALGSVLAVALLLPHPRALQHPPVPAALSGLAQARVTVDAERRTLIIDLPPIDLPASTPGEEAMTTLSPTTAAIPLSLAICSAAAEVVDSAGRPLPKAFLHHVNLADPTRRDLFVPTSMHILAVSKETPPLSLPGLLLGLPLERDQLLLVTAMLANPTSTPRRGLRVRVRLGYTTLGPLLTAYPWAMDAMFPIGARPDGSKAFDLPSGQSVRSWEGSPAVPGYVLGVGGHVHDYATKLEFADATTGQVLWSTVPGRDAAGHVLTVPITRFYSWHRLGLHITPSHRYRITVTYDNPTGHVLPGGGMGAVAGLIVPERGARWPAVDTTDAIYRQDLSDTLVPGAMGHMKM